MFRRPWDNSQASLCKPGPSVRPALASPRITAHYCDYRSTRHHTPDLELSLLHQISVIFAHLVNYPLLVLTQTNLLTRALHSIQRSSLATQFTQTHALSGAVDWSISVYIDCWLPGVKQITNALGQFPIGNLTPYPVGGVPI